MLRIKQFITKIINKQKIKKILNKLPKKDYIILNNLLIKTKERTHQIDHIVLSKYGIFVIEMKNYFGLIKGKEYERKWTQYLGKRKYTFLNPIRQNYSHTKAIQELLGIDTNNIISIICFSNQATLKIDTATKVFHLDNLKKEILSYKKVLITKNINKYSNKLIESNIKKQKERIEHIRIIKQNIKLEEKKKNEKICPICGGTLVERESKYGKFYGCSNYPNCTYTSNKVKK